MTKKKRKHKPPIKFGQAVFLFKVLANTHIIERIDPRADRALLGNQSNDVSHKMGKHDLRANRAPLLNQIDYEH